MTSFKYPRFKEALVYAAEMHNGQTRKGTSIPYITHPVAVAEILSRNNFEPEIVYAGLLHDVIEDTGVTQEALAEAFGPKVAALVAAVSEKKTEAKGKIPWDVRKQRQLQVLEESGYDVALLKAADVLHNLTTIVKDYASVGDKIWDRFNAGKEQQLKYYRVLINTLVEKLGTHNLSRELQNTLTKLLVDCGCSSEDVAATRNEGTSFSS